MRKFVTGWNRQPFDPRDRYLLVSNERAAAIPSSFDVDFSRVPQLNQGAEGSCGPNTVEELIYKDQLLQGLEPVGASRLFVYYWTRSIMGTISQDSGVDNRSMMKALASYGFPAESLWPYDDSRASMVRKPTQGIMSSAALNKATDYAAVVQSLSQMKAVVASGKPFLFGFDVYQQIDSDQAADNGILTDPSGTPIGGHDVAIVGYSDVDRPGEESGNKWPAGHFKFRNHWMNGLGKPWGDMGYGYVSYAYATNSAHAGDFWVINTVPGSITPPPLPPTPPVGDDIFFTINGTTYKIIKQ